MKRPPKPPKPSHAEYEERANLEACRYRDPEIETEEDKAQLARLTEKARRWEEWSAWPLREKFRKAGR